MVVQRCGGREVLVVDVGWYRGVDFISVEVQICGGIEVYRCGGAEVWWCCSDALFSAHLSCLVSLLPS